MLSHFMGGHNRASAKSLWLAERRAEQLAERLVRSRRQAQGTLAERDRKIADLEAELADDAPGADAARGGLDGHPSAQAQPPGCRHCPFRASDSGDPCAAARGGEGK